MPYPVFTRFARPLSAITAVLFALLASACAVPVNDGYAYGYGYDPYGGYATTYPSTVYDPGPAVVYGAPPVVFGSQIWLSSSERQGRRWQRDGWRDRDGQGGRWQGHGREHDRGQDRGPGRGQWNHDAGRGDRGHARPAPPALQRQPSWRPEGRQDWQNGHRGDGPRAPGSIMREMP
ncbi:hypothetical protein [Comamonas sp. NLF-1-9]|uniref:hypothetical protein n=1 Tax=Comamonas sp. NLF-1-9 TaxID=2853163 RepID=UPI001C48B0BC|nr:hypothetical protein [Comamonas sp. NLF-1-9]QXL85159.1 hypothetical protein KUD94_04050 [Comamonas sp. NLF-1-9]